MKKFWIFLSFGLLVLIGPSLAPVDAVIAMENSQNKVEGYWQLVEIIEEPDDKPLINDWHGKILIGLDSAEAQHEPSGTFTGDHPNAGSISYSITGVRAYYPPTEDIPQWRQGTGTYTNAYFGSARRVYTGYIVGDAVTLVFSFSQERMCQSLEFRSGEQVISIGCYEWERGERSGTFTLPAGQPVSFSLRVWNGTPQGIESISVSGTFTTPPEAPAATERPSNLVTPASPPAREPSPDVKPTHRVDPPSSDDSLWEIMIGGMAILGVAAAGTLTIAAAAAVLVARSRMKVKSPQEGQQQEGQEPESDGEEIVGYILQLSTNEIVLSDKDSQQFQVVCWQVKANGAYEHAPYAALQIQPPPASSNIVVTPLSGQGQMDVHVRLAGETDAETHQILVTASAGGQSTSAVVTLILTPALEMTLTTPDGDTHLDIGEDGLWACALITSESTDNSLTPDLRTPNITFRVDGPNANWIEMGQPIYRDNWQWVYLIARPPHPDARLERGNPALIADYQEANIILSEKMVLQLQTEYELRVKLFDAKSPDIQYHQGQATWQVPGLLVYWVNPDLGDTPVEPDFEYGFPDPPLVVEPPCLALSSFTDYAPGQYLMQFEVEQDLEQFFGEDLVEHNGLVKITVEAIDVEQEKHFAALDFQVRPEAIPLIYFWQDTPDQRIEQREHFGVNLNTGELVSDGEDVLGIGAFLARTDKIDDFTEAYHHPLMLTKPSNAELSGVNSSKYRLHEKSGDDSPHRYAGLVKTNQEEPVYYESQEHEMKVRVNLVLDQRRYPNYFFNSHASLMEVQIKPLEVFLKLWVLPGSAIGTSDAGGVLYLPAKKAPLVGKELTLDIQASGGASLTTSQPVRATNQDGMARWILDYHGLTWQNYNQVKFAIRCGLPSSKGGYIGTQAKIDIGYNVHKTLSDLHAQRKNKTGPNNLDLDNPEWERGSGFRASVGDWLFPDFLSGPCVNFVGFFTGKEHYVCSELRDRVLDWLQHRRNVSWNMKYEGFNEEKHMSMNGIEYGNYGIWFMGPIDHNFAGIFLSNKNANPLDSPRFVDPWWEQHWSSEKYKYPKWLYTKNQEIALQASTLAIKGLLFFLVTAFIGWKLGAAQVKVIKPKLKYFFGGLASANALWGVYLKEQVNYCPQNIERARRFYQEKPSFSRVEPIIRW